MEETICLQCGNRGFANAFVYCVRCTNFAVHRYCLDVIPRTYDEYVPWRCGCEVKHKGKIVSNHNVIPCETVVKIEDQVYEDPPQQFCEVPAKVKKSKSFTQGNPETNKGTANLEEGKGKRKRPTS